MLKSELRKLKEQSVRDFSQAVDISSVNIGKSKSQEQKVKDFLSVIGNPYIFKVGDLTVKVNFNGDKPFSEVLVNAVNYA